MEKNVTLGKIGELYSSNLAKTGMSSVSVGWKSEECQMLRFQKLSSVIEPGSEAVRVNDFGCGYGAHLKYLESIGINVSEYNGYDISDEMLAAARDYLSAFQGRLNLVKASEISTDADYSFVSGTFNVRFEASDAEWEDYIKDKLCEINERSSAGFAFNLLTSYVDWKDEKLYYGDPKFWFDFCKRNFSKAVNLIHDYPLYEWTIQVRK